MPGRVGHEPQSVRVAQLHSAGSGVKRYAIEHNRALPKVGRGPFRCAGLRFVGYGLRDGTFHLSLNSLA
jgi:hypothetical protein